MSTKWFEKSFSKDYTVYCANSAEAALTTMQLFGDDIAVVVSDFRMPERDGLELLRTLNQTHPWIVKILVSAYADKDLVIQAINQQLVFKVLEKPWDDKLMRRSLKEALAMFQQSLTSRDHMENSIGGMRDSLGFIAAEFYAPLTVIASCLNMIQSTLTEVDASQQIPHHLKSVLPALQASQRNLLACQNLMAGFTQSTHTAFAATETSPIQAARLVHLLCTEMSLPQGERQSWIQLDIKDDFVISTKQNLVYLCLTSIMQNAIQALQNYTQKPLIQIQLIDSKAPTLMLGHSIRISDNGPGIPPAVLTRILTSRPTASNEIVAGGSGMGLIFCKKIMLSLNGNISVNSTKAGTSVTLHFPYSKKD
jgi:two-component system response regulator PhcR